jgi:hypothetical protein
MIGKTAYAMLLAKDEFDAGKKIVVITAQGVKPVIGFDAKGIWILGEPKPEKPVEIFIDEFRSLTK